MPIRPSKLRLDYAFTIVELLIVIVVIAILATIAIVAYRGIQDRAKEATVKSDLSQAARQLALDKTLADIYPTTVNPDGSGNANEGKGLPKGSTKYEYSVDNIAGTFCLSGVNGTKAYHITNGGAPQDGVCPGHSGPSGGGGSGSGGGGSQNTMQAFARSDCNNLTTYTGANASALAILTDSRGIPRSYTIGKLVDGNCWMLDNLKLGLTTGTLTLTPSDSDVVANFTLPKILADSVWSIDTPTASGPVPGDTGSGLSNYGYLYNWSAATAGETQATKPAGSSDASYSICPKGWRLPTGGTNGDFTWLNAKMNNPSASAPSTAWGSGYYQNWQFTGPFRGVLSGAWGMWGTSGYEYQGSWGSYWSKTPYADSATSALNTSYYTYAFSPGDQYGRHVGLGVRCLLD